MSTIEICWDKFIASQKTLDREIHKKKNLKEEDTVLHRQIALLIELSEFINETKSFKYWSSSSFDRKKILLEYVDVLHFTLSLSITYKMEMKVNEYLGPKKIKQEELNKLFLKILEQAPNLIKIDSFSEWVTTFLCLGSACGFEYSEIESVYFEKLNINHKRQDDNY